MTEQEKDAPRLSPAHIEAQILEEHYLTFADNPNLETLTLCILVLNNGFKVVGESACVSRELFDEEIGRKIAREKAIDKVWPLEGYLLCELLKQAAA